MFRKKVEAEAQPDTPDLQENIDSNDRLAEGLVRGVQEMGASRATLPVHIDGETWDVTVRFRGARPDSQFEDWVIEAARQILAEIALEKPRLRTSRIAEIIQAARGGAQPEPDLNALVTDLRRHYDSDWDTTVPGKEFDAEISRIVLRHLRAGSSRALGPAIQCESNSITYHPTVAGECSACGSFINKCGHSKMRVYSRNCNDGSGMSETYCSLCKRAWVTGNEGKDHENGGRGESAEREQNRADTSAGGRGQNAIADGLVAPPLSNERPSELVSGGLTVDHLWRDFSDNYEGGVLLTKSDKLCKKFGTFCLSKTASKVSELGAQLQQARRDIDADSRDWKQIADELGCEPTREAILKLVRSRRAELERMRVGGKS